MIHDFWVPAFRMKIDAVPGIDTHLRVTTKSALGQLPGGVRRAVRARPLDDAPDRARAEPVGLRREAREAARPGRKPAGGGGGGEEETDGKTLFTEAAQPACASCHTLADAGSTGTTGPDLDEVIPNLSDAEIKQSIQDPDAKITEGFPAGIMPRYGETLSDEAGGRAGEVPEGGGWRLSRVRAPG